MHAGTRDPTTRVQRICVGQVDGGTLLVSDDRCGELLRRLRRDQRRLHPSPQDLPHDAQNLIGRKRLAEDVGGTQALRHYQGVR
jgi:hypothetical protein